MQFFHAIIVTIVVTNYYHMTIAGNNKSNVDYNSENGNNEGEEDDVDDKFGCVISNDNHEGDKNNYIQSNESIPVLFIANVGFTDSKLQWNIDPSSVGEIANFTICYCSKLNNRCDSKKYISEIVNFDDIDMTSNTYIIENINRSNHYLNSDTEVSSYSYTITDLKPGSNYMIFIIANHYNVYRPSSQSVKFQTLGYGGDANPCRCDKLRSVNNLCNYTDGQCQCKLGATSKSCSICANSYIFNMKGCEYCYCSKVGGHEKGNCFINSLGMKTCNCKEGYSGMECQYCANGYYREINGNLQRCIKCNCNNNENKNAIPFCQQSTGKCIACLERITGDNCELCATGFTGDALKGTCSLELSSGIYHHFSASNPYLMWIMLVLILISVIIIIIVAAVCFYKRFINKLNKKYLTNVAHLPFNNEDEAISEL